MQRANAPPLAPYRPALPDDGATYRTGRTAAVPLHSLAGPGSIGMSFIPSNVVPFVAHAAPRDPSQAPAWARRQLTRSLTAFTAVTSGPAPALAPAASAAFDVLTTTAAFLARAEPVRTAEELYWQIDAHHCDFTQDAIGDHTAKSLAAILRPLIWEAARALRLRRLTRAQTALIGVLYQALTAFVARDPDLHAVPVLALYDALRGAVAAADPRRAVVALGDLLELIGPAVAAADASVAPPPPRPTNWAADLVIEIQDGVVDDGSSYATTIARLEARRAQLDPSSTRDAQHAAWIKLRLAELEWQRRIACGDNS